LIYLLHLRIAATLPRETLIGVLLKIVRQHTAQVRRSSLRRETPKFLPDSFPPSSPAFIPVDY